MLEVEDFPDLLGGGGAVSFKAELEREINSEGGLGLVALLKRDLREAVRDFGVISDGQGFGHKASFRRRILRIRVFLALFSGRAIVKAYAKLPLYGLQHVVYVLALGPSEKQALACCVLHAD